MDQKRLIILSNKLRKLFNNLKTPSEVYTSLRSNQFIISLIKDERLSAEDLIKLTFNVFLLNSGINPELINNYLKNIFAFIIVYINEENPEVECERCDGNGELECGECYGSGEFDCSNCDGSGEISCDYCGSDGEVECNVCDGNGEDDEGDSCNKCYGDGVLTCGDCNGKGDVKCEDCGGSGSNDCDYCDGLGKYECTQCDGSGYVNQEDSHSVIEYYYVSINPKFKINFTSIDENEKISNEFAENLSSDKLTILVKTNEDITEDFYGDFYENDFVFYSLNEEPKLYFINNPPIVSFHA